MPVSLSLEETGDGIGNAWAVLRDNAARAGLDAPVPSCPAWAVRQLVAHQGMVHRWAAGVVRGEADVDTNAVERDGLASADLLAWLDEGATALLSALAFAPDDLDVAFFLEDAPPAREAWARRQCHETTIHAVDAMAAALGRAPRASETWFSSALAQDGVDELLRGFVPRRKQRLRSPEPRTVLVRATDTGAEWTMRITSEPVVTTIGALESADAQDQATIGAVTELTGTATQLYLGLWNRGDEVQCTGPDVLTLWRQRMAVLW